MHTDYTGQNDVLTRIFLAGVERVNPEELIRSRLSLKDQSLVIAMRDDRSVCDLSSCRRILVLGAGKASARMARGLEDVLGGRITDGLISVKYGHTERLDRIRTIEAGHPVPDMNSERAAEEILSLASRADEETLVILLMSGGGSSLLCLPRTDSPIRITLEEKQETTKLLLSCGATIGEINCVRKHLSGIKGGRLAQAIFPARCLNLILSDVVGDRLDSIASGPAVPDPTSFRDARELLDRYGIWNAVPGGVREIVTLGVEGQAGETPKEGDPVFRAIDTRLVGTNREALLASAEKAAELGFKPILLSSMITGEARETAKFYAALAKEAARYPSASAKPVCYIGGGETTVTLKGKGTGGRNQEMALSFLNEFADEPDLLRGVCFLSAGTDGNDGPTDAAGAFASSELLALGRKAGLNTRAFLSENNSYGYFSPIGGLLMTGPTNTNVCDIHLMIVT